MTIAAVTPAATTPSASSLGLQDFIKVLTTQLTYQDPLKPMDNQQFMAQVAQFTALEQSQQMNERMQQLVDNQAALQSIGLIGRTVEISTAAGRTSGTVTALSLQGEAPVLTLALPGGAVLEDVSLSQLIAIR
jgi:flagellar basal-body rod modification protein FlgD